MTSPESQEIHKRSLLSPAHYDDDAASLRSASDQDSDSEDDQVLQGAQSSLEIAEHDRSLLKEEEEREKLLTGDSAGKGLRRIFSGPHSNGSKVKIGRQERRTQRRQDRRAARRKKRGRNDEEGELMYEMEEGGLRDDASSASSNSSSEMDRQKFHSVFGNKVNGLQIHCGVSEVLQSGIVKCHHL